ncbi:hypothetical protein M885DRAFT_30530 [Pelagophyceae sp. CCMP2097]|nr:hypothetical protein M885DRAFT_30530 [Pelagophyceae sp. CCMP2097]
MQSLDGLSTVAIRARREPLESPSTEPSTGPSPVQSLEGPSTGSNALWRPSTPIPRKCPLLYSLETGLERALGRALERALDGSPSTVPIVSRRFLHYLGGSSTTSAVPPLHKTSAIPRRVADGARDGRPSAVRSRDGALKKSLVRRVPPLTAYTVPLRSLDGPETSPERSEAASRRFRGGPGKSWIDNCKVLGNPYTVLGNPYTVLGNPYTVLWKSLDGLQRALVQSRDTPETVSKAVSRRAQRRSLDSAPRRHRDSPSTILESGFWIGNFKVLRRLSKILDPGSAPSQGTRFPSTILRGTVPRQARYGLSRRFLGSPETVSVSSLGGPSAVPRRPSVLRWFL